MLAATPLITIFAHRRPALGRDALEAVMDCALPFRLEFAAFAQVPPHRLTVGHFFRFVRKDDLAWTLWTARCRQRAIDPFRPPQRDEALADYQRFLIAWGYAAPTARHRRGRVQYLLRLLSSLPAPQPRSYATEIEALLDQLEGPSRRDTPQPARDDALPARRARPLRRRPG